MEKQPEQITLCVLECVLMPQGEIICMGKTLGWFKDLKTRLHRTNHDDLTNAIEKISQEGD